MNTNLNGIPVALGTATFGTSVPQSNAFELLDKYASLGGRTLDTANNYAFWHPDGKGGDSETVLGEWLENQDRTAFTVITKIGSQPAKNDKDANNLEGLSPGAINSAVNKSLARLKTESIDILLAHHDDRNTPLLDTWKTFTQLVESGKVKCAGISNYHPERIIELVQLINKHNLAPIDAVQLKYSVIDPAENADFDKLVALNAKMRETLATHVPNTIVFGYAPLLGGLFEKDTDRKFPTAYDTPQNRQQVETIRQAAENAGISASAYVLKETVDNGIIPVTSTRNPERLETNLAPLSKK
ncbi:MAG: aldo/keto reductase [bacterium]|nr:aldo/keto reductase [bacterium]